MWEKAYELSSEQLLKIDLDAVIKNNVRIIAKHVDQSGIILIACAADQLIDMISDTVPNNAIFEIWMQSNKPSLNV